MSRGVFYGIGVGPGDPELVTLKAIRAIESLDVLVVPSGNSEGKSEAYLIAESYVQPHTTVASRHFPMTKDVTRRDEQLAVIAREIVSMMEEGKRVGFLTLGDPMVYSTYVYLLRRIHLVSPTVESVTIPGITSFTAIASAVEHSLVEGDEPLVVFPCTAENAEERVRALLREDSALVLMKAYRNFEAIRAVIDECGMLDCAVVSSNFGKADEITAPLRTYRADEISYFTTILVRPKHRRVDR